MGAQFVEVEHRDRGVAWIYLNSFTKVLADADSDTMDVHAGLGWALHELRYDRNVRIVVLTGRDDGEFYSVPATAHYAEPGVIDRINPLKRPEGFAGPSHHPDAIEVLAHIEKPVIARVNGDVIGFGQSALWGCDIILARDDAVVADVHTGQGEVVDSRGEHRGFPPGISPGDGAMAFFPFFVTPTQLKEYMFLSKAWTTRELADMHAINRAVPMADLDALVDEFVKALLARPPSVLAHTKRLCNKHIIHHANLTRDLSSAYERLDLWQHAKDQTM